MTQTPWQEIGQLTPIRYFRKEGTNGGGRKKEVEERGRKRWRGEGEGGRVGKGERERRQAVWLVNHDNTSNPKVANKNTESVGYFGQHLFGQTGARKSQVGTHKQFLFCFVYARNNILIGSGCAILLSSFSELRGALGGSQCKEHALWWDSSMLYVNYAHVFMLQV